MSKIELLEMLTREATEFRKDRSMFSRNKHMHTMVNEPSQETIDAVLTMFINHIGVMQGVDYGLYTKDLK